MRKKRIEAFDIVVYTIAALLVLIVLYPLVYMLSASISDPSLVATGKVVLLPKGLSFAGYQEVFKNNNIMRGYINSIFYVVLGTAINLIVTVPAGYALSKTLVPGTSFIMKMFMLTMYFGGGMIPTFIVVSGLGLYDTWLVLVILGAFSTYNCIICRSFFVGIPADIEEAAYIDGASHMRTFITIVLPISKALLGVMVLYFAVAHWNSYFTAMIYVPNRDQQPLQMVLRRILILNQQKTDNVEDEYAAKQAEVAELIKYAVIVVSSLPLMILYPFLQKYFDKGVMIGSVKG